MNEKVILAPMVRGSERAFRHVVRKYGVNHCYSPMLRADLIVSAFQIYQKGDFKSFQQPELLSHLQHNNEDGMLLFTEILFSKEEDDEESGQLTVQLCGSCPQTLYQATEIVLSSAKRIYGIDLNLGCPQSCALDGNFGAFLVKKNPQLAMNCVAAMKRAIDASQHQQPILSCKLRLLHTTQATIDFCKELQAAGCQFLALHCRQRGEKHNGRADLQAGAALVSALDGMPVVLNGMQPYEIPDTLSKTGCYSVMLARAFLTNPRLLQEPKDVDPASLAAEYLQACQEYPPPSPLYIQKHLRWIFRDHLQPKEEDDENYKKDWRARLWTFLVRPYLKTVYQFQLVVALYVQSNGSVLLPESLKHLPVGEITFQSIRHSRDDNSHCVNQDEMQQFQTQAMVHIF